MNQKDEVPKRNSKPQLIKLDNAFKLAEQWVKNVRSSDDQSSTVVLEDRPPRLGVGAAVPRQAHVVPEGTRKLGQINFKGATKQERLNFEEANHKFYDIFTENE